MSIWKKTALTLGLFGALSMMSGSAIAEQSIGIKNNTTQGTKMETEKLSLGQAWDKVFPKSDRIIHSKVTFVNRFGITLAADMYVHKNATGKLPAIAVSGPFGAVKEQSSGLYAQKMLKEVS